MAGAKSLNFPPEKQRGTSVHATLIGALGLITGVATWLATYEQIGPRLVVYILAAVLAFAPLPVLAYRLFALTRSNYSLDRDKLTINWGLRVEKIPVSDIEWVRPLSALATPLPLPFLRLPGSILGHRNYEDVGQVEYIASDANNLLLIATRTIIVAISPADPAGFVQNLQSAMEMGSLSPEAAESVYPSFVIIEGWKERPARFLWLAALFLNIGLLAWVSLMTPQLPQIPLGFLSSGAPKELVPGVSLILLPILSIFLCALGWVLGLVVYRRASQKILAYMLWINNVITTILFLLAVMFILSAA